MIAGIKSLVGDCATRMLGASKKLIGTDRQPDNVNRLLDAANLRPEDIKVRLTTMTDLHEKPEVSEDKAMEKRKKHEAGSMLRQWR